MNHHIRSTYVYRAFFLIGLVLSVVTVLRAQPENPDFSLSTSVFFEIDMKTIALVDIETFGATNNFTLNIPVPTEAGNPLGSNPLATNSDNWINYSNAVPIVTSRNIEVSISSGSVPSDFELELTVGAATGAGAGNLGTAASGPLTLSGTPQDLITNIRGAYTGDGPGNGHQLTFALNYLGTNFDQLDSQDINLSILYTIVDN